MKFKDCSTYLAKLLECVKSVSIFKGFPLHKNGIDQFNRDCLPSINAL